MNIRLLKAEWSEPCHGYTTYTVQVLVGAMYPGRVLQSQGTVDTEPLAPAHLPGHLERVASLTRQNAADALMQVLLEEHNTY
jgi:hypothetical protein